MTEELQRVLKELHSITNKFALTGQGVAGDLLHGYTVDVQNAGGSFGGGGGGGGATGACCTGEVCTITSEALCVAGGGIYQGDDTTCSPNPCANPNHVHLTVTITVSGGCEDKTYVITTPAMFDGDLDLTDGLFHNALATGSSGTQECDSEGTVFFQCNMLCALKYSGGAYTFNTPGYNFGIVPVGSCDACTDTGVPNTNHVVTVGSNNIPVSQGGITTTFQVDLSLL